MVIFLDIDGVLNREAQWKKRNYIDINNVKNLVCLAKRIGINDVVLSSTWRAGYTNDSSDCLGGLQEILQENGLRIIGKTPSSNHSRQREIEYYASRHDCGKYLILDDDASLFDNPNAIPLYIVNYKTGLAENDINRALRMYRNFWKK